MKATVIGMISSLGLLSLEPKSMTSLWFVRWQLEMVTPVDWSMTSMRPCMLME